MPEPARSLPPRPQIEYEKMSKPGTAGSIANFLEFWLPNKMLKEHTGDFLYEDVPSSDSIMDMVHYINALEDQGVSLPDYARRELRDELTGAVLDAASYYSRKKPLYAPVGGPVNSFGAKAPFELID